jgi:hypothetical protein
LGGYLDPNFDVSRIQKFTVKGASKGTVSGNVSLQVFQLSSNNVFMERLSQGTWAILKVFLNIHVRGLLCFRCCAVNADKPYPNLFPEFVPGVGRYH